VKAQTKEEAIAILKACAGYESIEFHEDEFGTLCGTHANGLPVRIVGTDDAGWFEVHGGICKIWLDKGGAAGELGLPFSNEERDPDCRDPNGKRSRFQHGTIHGWPTDPNNPNGEWSFEVELTSAIPVMSLSTKTKARLEKLDREIESFRRLSEEYGEGNPLEKPLSEIERIRRAFDSKTFFMVTFGMLKAGKSTLVNTFVGREICPVGRSKETTLQSSIILAADEQHGEGIYIYSPKKDYSPEKPSEEIPSGEENWTADAKESLSNDNKYKWKSEHCRKLMEYLGGTLLEEELAETFKVDFIPLSDGALETILTSDPIRFPGDANETRPNAMPPVIRIDRLKVKDADGVATLLQSGVAILDTPGLDGARANATRDPFWDVLPQYGDYYLLVQSSMSAINKSCLDLVKKVCGATRDMPVLVVFNEMAADFWLKPEAEKAKLRADADEALKDLFKQLQGALGGKLPESVSINAGEASGAVFGTDDADGPFSKKIGEMAEESRIRILRDRIVETLMTRRGEIKEQNATNRLLKDLNNQEANLQKAKEQIDKERKGNEDEFGNRHTKFESARNEIQSAFEKDGEGVRLAKAIGARMESRLKEVFADSIFIGLPGSDFRKYKTKNKEDETYRNGPEVEELLSKAKAQVASDFEESVRKQFADGDLGIGVDGAFREKWESLEKERNFLAEKVASLTKSDGGLIREDVKDRGFPKSLVQNFDIESILLAVGEAKKKINIPEIPRVNWALFRNRVYGSDTVYECKCFDAFEILLERMKNVFPDKAASLVGKAVEEAIREKGRAYANGLAERVNVALKKMEEENGNRQAIFQRRIENLDEAERTLERMKKIFQEG